MSDGRMMTVTEAAAEMGLSVRSIRNKVRSGMLGHRRVPVKANSETFRIVISTADIKAYQDRLEREAARGT